MRQNPRVYTLVKDKKEIQESHTDHFDRETFFALETPREKEIGR